MFFQAFLLNRMADPGAPSNKGILLANFFLQFFLELICDTVCLYVEDTKLKALGAGSLRHPRFAEGAFDAINDRIVGDRNHFHEFM